MTVLVPNASRSPVLHLARKLPRVSEAFLLHSPDNLLRPVLPTPTPTPTLVTGLGPELGPPVSPPA